jgi:hypothetical protein
MFKEVKKSLIEQIKNINYQKPNIFLLKHFNIYAKIYFYNQYRISKLEYITLYNNDLDFNLNPYCGSDIDNILNGFSILDLQFIKILLTEND